MENAKCQNSRSLVYPGAIDPFTGDYESDHARRSVCLYTPAYPCAYHADGFRNPSSLTSTHFFVSSPASEAIAEEFSRARPARRLAYLVLPSIFFDDLSLRYGVALRVWEIQDVLLKLVRLCFFQMVENTHAFIEPSTFHDKSSKTRKTFRTSLHSNSFMCALNISFRFSV